MPKEIKHNHTGHRDRLRARYNKNGIDSFEQHEILELLLYYCIARKDTNNLAHELLNRFGSISAVFDAPKSELLKIDGIGDRSAELIKLIPHLARVYLEDKSKAVKSFNTNQEVVSYMRNKFIGMGNEVIAALFVDNRGAIVEYSVISVGSVNMSEVDVRKIMKICLTNDSTGIVIAHNHPRGLAAPTEEDVQTTKNLFGTLASIRVALLDHVIYGEDGTYISVMKNIDYKNLFTLAQGNKKLIDFMPANSDDIISEEALRKMHENL